MEEGYDLVIGGGFSDNLKAVSVKKGGCEDIVELFSDHEEADTRLLLHASHIHGHPAELSFSLAVFVQHTLKSFPVKNCGSRRVCAISFDSYLYIRFVKNLDTHCALLYLDSMLLLDATRLVVSVEKIKRDRGILCVKLLHNKKY